MDVTVVVATFGGAEWKHLAEHRAIPSAQRLGVPVIHAHETTLHDARNAGLERVTTSHIIYLDADDELETGYTTAMMTGTCDLRAPQVRYVHNAVGQRPAFPRVYGHGHACVAECLLQGNWMVIGTMAPVGLLREVGGWRDWPWSEDWDLWLRCYLAGATVEGIPAAIYRAHVSPHSRNRGASHAVRMATHRAIEAANGLGGVRL
jgi:hypothetical protein